MLVWNSGSDQVAAVLETDASTGARRGRLAIRVPGATSDLALSAWLALPGAARVEMSLGQGGSAVDGPDPSAVEQIADLLSPLGKRRIRTERRGQAQCGRATSR